MARWETDGTVVQQVHLVHIAASCFQQGDERTAAGEACDPPAASVPLPASRPRAVALLGKTAPKAPCIPGQLLSAKAALAVPCIPASPAAHRMPRLAQQQRPNTTEALPKPNSSSAHRMPRLARASRPGSYALTPSVSAFSMSMVPQMRSSVEGGEGAGAGKRSETPFNVDGAADAVLC